MSSPGHPDTSAYRKPWNVLVGSNASGAAAEDEPVGRLRVAEWPSAQLAVLQHLGVTDPDLAPCRARTVNRTQPTRFWPKSTMVRPDGERQDLDGRDHVLTANLRTDVGLEDAVSNSMVRTGYSGTTWNMFWVGVNGTYHSCLRRRASIV